MGPVGTGPGYCGCRPLGNRHDPAVLPLGPPDRLAGNYRRLHPDGGPRRGVPGLVAGVAP